MFKAITDSPHDYLRQELGVNLRGLQDANLILAIEKPGDFIEKRQSTIAAMFDSENSPIPALYNEKILKYETLGLPFEMCKTLAMKSATRLYEEELELLELQQPGAYQKAFGVAGLAHNATIAKNDIVNPNAETVEQYKARRKAKKAARRG